VATVCTTVVVEEGADARPRKVPSARPSSGSTTADTCAPVGDRGGRIIVLRRGEPGVRLSGGDADAICRTRREVQSAAE